ncbi:MAG: helix-turn-helix domain-containing protein [Vicinamibacterales bacterium]
MRTDSQPRTVEQAAAELNLSKATIRAWIAQRRLGHVRLGRAIRVPAEEIHRVLQAGYVPPRREDRRNLLDE